jgi:DNA mismatch endonuclease, patch repair protein
MDPLSPEERSERMRRVRHEDTKLELRVRRLVYSMGYRYRLHSKDLPGHPDMVFTSRRKVIFIHGCFWHRHEGCPLARLPKSRTDFWIPKLESNRRRDEVTRHRLSDMGWNFLLIWECETKDMSKLKENIESFMEGDCEVG